MRLAINLRRLTFLVRQVKTWLVRGGGGLNDNGQVPVWAQSLSGPLTLPVADVYNLNSNTYSAIPTPPDSVPFTTNPYGINNNGVIVGQFENTNSSIGWQAFSYSGGIYSSPQPAFGLLPSGFDGISNNGNIAGYVNTPSDVGFLLSNGQYTLLNTPPYNESAYANAVNNSGEVVGTYSPNGCTNCDSFIYQNGVYSPLMLSGWEEIQAFAINNDGVIAGFVTNDPSNPDSASSGFIDQNGVFSLINVPGASSTQIFGINNLNQISGSYLDANGNFEAFVASPVPLPSTLSLLAAGFFGSGAYRRKMHQA